MWMYARYKLSETVVIHRTATALQQGVVVINEQPRPDGPSCGEDTAIQ